MKKQKSNLARERTEPELSVEQRVSLHELLYSDGYDALKIILEQGLLGAANDIVAADPETLSMEECHAKKLKFKGAQEFVIGVVSYMDGERARISKENAKEA